MQKNFIFDSRQLLMGWYTENNASNESKQKNNQTKPLQ